MDWEEDTTTEAITTADLLARYKPKKATVKVTSRHQDAIQQVIDYMGVKKDISTDFKFWSGIFKKRGYRPSDVLALLQDCKKTAKGQGKFYNVVVKNK